MRTFLYWLVRLTLRPFLAPWVPIPLQRLWGRIAALSVQGPAGCTTAPLQMEGVAARKLVPATARPGHVILYLHGGAYVIGGPASHGKLAAQLGHAARCEVYFVDYRLAPEHPFPAALDDALAAYRWLLAQGLDARRVIVAGDSAGAGLALATALALRERKLPLPGALVLISPWTDLTLGGTSHRSHAQRDPMLRASWLADSAQRYAAGRPLTDPLLSPLFADLSGLPPMLVQVGSEEILLSDAEGLAQRAGAAGTAVTLRRYDGLWHDFQVHAGLLPEADRALAEIGAFVETSHAQASG
jgi:acetyl esterase/lipase